MCKGLLLLCKDAMKLKSTNDHFRDWFGVIPLCHFLSGACKPFSRPDYDPREEHFNARAKEFGYDAVKTKLSPGYDTYSLCIVISIAQVI